MRVPGIVEGVINKQLTECELCQCDCGAEFTRSLKSKKLLCRECDRDEYMAEFFTDRQQDFV